jgi:hypothetical protein
VPPEASLVPTIITAIIAAAAVFTIGLNWHYHSTQEKRSRKYEQVRISREIWVEVLKQNRLIHEWPLDNTDSLGNIDYKKLKREMDSVKNDLDYFVYFFEKGEITEPDILGYYRKRVVDIRNNIGLITKQGVYSHVKGWDETKEILGGIERYLEKTNEFKNPDEIIRREVIPTYEYHKTDEDRRMAGGAPNISLRLY